MIVVWRVTERCNLSCPFCAYDRRLSRTRRDADPESIERFGAVLAEYQCDTGDSTLVSWIGGEPMLWPNLPRLSTLFAGRLGLRVSATTNGTALQNETLRALVLAHFAELTVSVDGVETVHNQLRGWPGGFQTLRGAVLQLAEQKRQHGRGPRLRANVVLMRQTIASFPDLCLELARWGIEEITFNALGGRDRPEFFPSHRLLPSQVEALTAAIPPIRARLAQHSVCLSGSQTYLSRLGANAREESMPVANCRPGERFLFINEDGLVSPCHFTTAEYGVSIEALRNTQSLLELPRRFAHARQDRFAPACLDCQSTQFFEKFNQVPAPVRVTHDQH